MNLKEIKQVIEDHKITLSIPKEKGSYPIYYLFAHEDHEREENLVILGLEELRQQSMFEKNLRNTYLAKFSCEKPIKSWK